MFSFYRAACKWNGCFSHYSCIRSGIRQGGILSLVLFNIYIDSLICALKRSDYGCHMGDVYLGCIAYAYYLAFRLSVRLTENVRHVLFM